MWHCHVHQEEFETQPDYMQHLHDRQLEHRPEDSEMEMVAAVVGASSKPHRDCPFCPTAFSDVATMQRHVRYHLERLALYALPDIAEEESSELASGQSFDSHRVVENRGRQDSVIHDFTDEEERIFLEISGRSVDGTHEPHQSKVTMEDNREFAATLLQVPTVMSDIGSIIQWITNCLQSPWSGSGSSESANRIMNYAEPLEEVKETRSELGAEHPDKLAVMAALVSRYIDQGRWKEAEELQMQVMETSSRALGEEHPGTLTHMANLASTYTHQGRWKEVEELQMQVIETSSRVLGEEHPHTLASVNNLGFTLEKQGRYKDAEAMYKRALYGKEKVLGSDNISTLDTVKNLGLLYRSMARLDEAEKMHLRALQGYEKALGPEVVKTYVPALDIAYSMALLFQHTGRIQEAEVLYERALSGFEAVFGRTSEMYRNISGILEALRSSNNHDG